MDRNMSDTTESQNAATMNSSSFLDFALDRTLDDWCARIKNLGNDVPLDKLAQMLLDTTDASITPQQNESQRNTTFEPLSYSIIDRDERSYCARNQRKKDVTFQNNGPLEVSWKISPEDNISLFESRIMNRSTSRCSAEEVKDEVQRTLNGTSDLMDRIKAMSSDVSSSDMADLLLPPPNGKSTKERLASGSSNSSGVPNISDITKLIKSGLSPEDLINQLLVTPTDSKKNEPKVDDKESNTSADDSFVPMSYSIIDQDEESILKKYQMGNDVTLQGIHNSNISWRLNPEDISLFIDHKSANDNRSFLRSVGENNVIPDKSPF